jgi:hypothetical protein
MATEIQDHPLEGGGTLQISRNGNHQYWVDDGIKVPSVTGLVGHVDGDGFGAGMGWALKIAKAHEDLDAPRRVSKAAKDEGTRLHEDIDAYIKTGAVAEDNPLLVAWLHELGNRDWLTSESFCYNASGFGGTIDAISREDNGLYIADWKTVDPDSWHKHGSSLRRAKDSAQLAAYAYTLREMGSIYAPLYGSIAYIMRDASKIVVEEVDLAWGWKLFQASKTIYDLRKKG